MPHLSTVGIPFLQGGEDVKAIVSSVLAATLTGILSGLIPASKAASIQAAESLRYD